MIGVISYRTGNARSVLRALEHLELSAVLISSPDGAGEADRFILPGVGAADVTMSSLASAGWVEHLRHRVLDGGAPFLGVCVGHQILFECSEEGDTPCLGWLPGRVERFRPGQVRVPQMGWNAVQFSGDHPWVAGVPDDYYYFVNSYHVRGATPSDVVGTTDYGGAFTSAVASRNVMGTQFHIEKSGPVGLSLLRRFAALSPEDLC